MTWQLGLLESGDLKHVKCNGAIDNKTDFVTNVFETNRIVITYLF